MLPLSLYCGLLVRNRSWSHASIIVKGWFIWDIILEFGNGTLVFVVNIVSPFEPPFDADDVYRHLPFVPFTALEGFEC